MMLGQSSTKKHSEQSTSEDAQGHDPTDFYRNHDPSLLAITASGAIVMWTMTWSPNAMLWAKLC